MSRTSKIVSGSSSYSLRNYRADEADLACDVRGLVSEESRSRFKKRFETIGEWTDHYLHLAIAALRKNYARWLGSYRDRYL
jgi:hypothetical protein